MESKLDIKYSHTFGPFVVDVTETAMRFGQSADIVVTHKPSQVVLGAWWTKETMTEELAGQFVTRTLTRQLAEKRWAKRGQLYNDVVKYLKKHVK